MTYRIGIVALLHESNTFISEKTTLELFQRNALLTGGEVVDFFADAPHEIGGFITSLKDAKDCEVVPIFAARAMPYGTIDAKTFDHLVEMMLQQMDAAGPLDGILAAPHGATVAQNAPDADGHWLTLVRNRLGPDKPIIATIDPHANVSKRMVDATDALIAYRTNPHLDQHQRGVEAAELMRGTLTSGRRLHQLAEMPPIAINIQNQNTDAPPLKPIWDQADKLRELPEVASLSLAMGFPYADVHEMGCAAILVSYQDVPLSRKQALLRELVDPLISHRESFEPKFVAVADAVRLAGQQSGVTCLLDMGDNVGGGSPADATFIAHELHRQRIGPSFVCINDPEAVACVTTGSRRIYDDVRIGGKVDRLHGEPLVVGVERMGQGDGKFNESEARHGGFSQFDQGETVIVRTIDSELTIMLTSRRTPPFSLNQLTTFGVDPRQFRAIVAKGVIAPMAAYRAVVDRFIHVNSPGCTCADMRKLNYQNRRRPMFPFES
ncbi:MAG: M81 family metallopeptidase [Pirellulaceae bacterium]